MDFLYELPNGYHDYPAHVLSLIDKYLGYHMLTFIPLNRSFLDLRSANPKAWLTEYRTLGIPRELLEIYNLRGYKLDPFRFCNMPQDLWTKPVVAAEDAFPPGEFQRSEYGQYLAELGIPYQLVLNLTFKNIRLGVISIYHSLLDGPFTSRDKEVLFHASRFIAQHYLLAMERSPIKDIEIKYILKQALTDRVNDREVYMKGIDHSYYYEGYAVYKAEDL